jgi:hypothetical protein
MEMCRLFRRLKVITEELLQIKLAVVAVVDLLPLEATQLQHLEELVELEQAAQ